MGLYPQLAHHSCEIPFVFHVLEAHGPNADKYRMHGEAEVALSAAMVRYWRNFASSGDPNVHAAAPPPAANGSVGARRAASLNLPHWPRYSHSGSDVTMVFGDDADGAPSVGARHGVKRAQCDYWDMLYGWSEAGLGPRRRDAAPRATAAALWG